MSELDIQLQEQTADVSITEMMQESHNIQASLISKDSEKEKKGIGGE